MLFNGNLTIINQYFMVTLLLSISFYGNLTMYEDFSWLPYYGIRIIFRYLSIITLLQQLDDFNEFIEFNEDLKKTRVNVIGTFWWATTRELVIFLDAIIGRY